MNILILSPTIEDKHARGINAIAKNIIDAAHELNADVGILTGIPGHNTVKRSETISSKIEHTIMQNYLLWGKESFGFIRPGGNSKASVLKSILSGSIYRSKKVTINKEHLGQQPGNLLKKLDFCIQSPYIYQFINHGYKGITKKALRKITKEHAIDVVITTSPVVLEKSWVHPSTKIVQFIHDAMPIEMVETPPDNNTPYVFGAQYESAILNADLLLANSEDTKQRIKEVKKDANIEVLYTAISKKNIDTSRSAILKSKNIEAGKYLYYNAAIEKRKNISRIIEAYSLAFENIDKMPLVLAGAPGYGFDEILETYNQLPQEVQDNVIFTGWVTETDRMKLFECANSFIFPSLKEGLGITILEAMLYEIPVLTTNYGALAEMGEDSVLYVDNPYDVQEIANGIERIVHDNALRADLIEKGKETAAKYTPEAFSKRIKKALKQLKD